MSRLLGCLLLVALHSACGSPTANEAEVSEAAQEVMTTPQPTSPATGTRELPLQDGTETKIERQTRQRREILTNGYFNVDMVMEREPSERYQANKGRWFRFNPNGNYALYDADGGVVHTGTWVYERRGNKQHYVTLAATKQQYNNEYRMYISPDAIVFVGTEKYSNPGVQMKTSRYDKAPFAANL